MSGLDPLGTRLAEGFRTAFGGPHAFVARAPGRVNLIGEHTDYNGGFVLPCALGVETRIAARSRGDRSVRVVALDFGCEVDEFAVGPNIAHHPAGGWRDYVRGMVGQIARTHGRLGGVDLAIAGDIPKGTGLSSSASLEVAVGFAMLHAHGLAIDPIDVALLAQAAENDFVGMRCGNMDQLASAASVAGHALLIDCRSLALTPVPLPHDTAVLIIQSGVERGLVDGHYNRRRAACETAAAALGVPMLRDADPASLDAAVDSEPLRRARHVVTENARVLAATEALRAGDLVGLGRLMAASHASMRDDFEITVPAIDSLVAIAQDEIGPEGGARMTGGGFGGAVVAVLRSAEIARVTHAISVRYRTPAGTAPTVLAIRPSAGAGIMA